MYTNRGRKYLKEKFNLKSVIALWRIQYISHGFVHHTHFNIISWTNNLTKHNAYAIRSKRRCSCIIYSSTYNTIRSRCAPEEQKDSEAMRCHFVIETKHTSIRHPDRDPIRSFTFHQIVAGIRTTCVRVSGALSPPSHSPYISSFCRQRILFLSCHK